MCTFDCCILQCWHAGSSQKVDRKALEQQMIWEKRHK